MATRVSLVRSVRRKEQREQLGELVMPFTQSLLDIEKKCLLRLSESAREAQHLQVALNSVLSAQRLEKTQTDASSQEFASVLWLQKEQKLAVELLKQIIRSYDPAEGQTSEEQLAFRATLHSRLVSAE